jgi:zinc transport system substrate-binding protein/iron/zinc/copper transport system substrate-binding protein
MAASRSRLILYAGWEIFAQKLADTAGSAGVELVKVATASAPSGLVDEARRISEILGTGPAFDAWREGFEALTEDLRRAVMAAYPQKRAVVHYDQVPLARWLGFEIAGEYGPAEPSPRIVLQLAALSPDLVIDNYHNPSGRPIAEAAGAPLAELIFFPGKNGTASLEDLFRYNGELLIEASGTRPPR